MEQGCFTLGSRRVGKGCPALVVAEIGCNHNGDPELARELVRAAIEAGVDAVKFQKRSLADLYCRDVLLRTADYEQSYQYLIPILERVELAEETLAELAGMVREAGLEFLCTPFDLPSAEVVARLGVNGFKVASADLTNFPLIEKLASYQKPLILSTGMSRWEEIVRTAAFLRSRGARFALLHCTSTYPVHAEDVNLVAMDRLADLGVPVGYSGHELGVAISTAAVARGAAIVERHLTLDRGMYGPDHRASLLPAEMAELVRAVREVESALGTGKKTINQGEVLNREVLGKGLVAARDLPAGTVLAAGMLVAKSPARGLSPQRLEEVLGKRLARGLEADEPLTEADLAVRHRRCVARRGLGRWGVVVRPADLHELEDLNPPVYEFHLTQEDLARPFPRRDFRQELVVHAPEYHQGRLLDLASGDEALRMRSVTVLRRVGEKVREMAPYFAGVPKLVVHPGGMGMQPMEAESHEAASAEFARRFALSLEEAELDRIEVLPENLPPYPWYLGGKWYTHFFAQVDEVARFCEEHGYGLCLDLSHAQLYCNTNGVTLPGYTRRVRGLVRHLHVSDASGTDGEGLQIGEGEIDFEAVVGELGGYSACGQYEGTWVPEIWRGHQDRGAGFRTALERLSGLFPSLEAEQAPGAHRAVAGWRARAGAR